MTNQQQQAALVALALRILRDSPYKPRSTADLANCEALATASIIEQVGRAVAWSPDDGVDEPTEDKQTSWQPTAMFLRGLDGIFETVAEIVTPIAKESPAAEPLPGQFLPGDKIVYRLTFADQRAPRPGIIIRSAVAGDDSELAPWITSRKGCYLISDQPADPGKRRGVEVWVRADAIDLVERAPRHD